jgi:hypothetical protein
MPELWLVPTSSSAMAAGFRVSYSHLKEMKLFQPVMAAEYGIWQLESVD